jgi:hypothetical protein
MRCDGPSRWLSIVVLVSGSLLHVDAGGGAITNATQRTKQVLEQMKSLAVRHAPAESTNGVPLVDYSTDWMVKTNWPEVIYSAGIERRLYIAPPRLPGQDYRIDWRREDLNRPYLTNFGRVLTYRGRFVDEKGVVPTAWWDRDGKPVGAKLSVNGENVFELGLSAQTGNAATFWSKNPETRRYEGEYYDADGNVVGTSWVYKTGARIYRWRGESMREREFYENFRKLHARTNFVDELIKQFSEAD